MWSASSKVMCKNKRGIFVRVNYHSVLCGLYNHKPLALLWICFFWSVLKKRFWYQQNNGGRKNIFSIFFIKCLKTTATSELMAIPKIGITTLLLHSTETSFLVCFTIWDHSCNWGVHAFFQPANKFGSSEVACRSWNLGQGQKREPSYTRRYREVLQKNPLWACFRRVWSLPVRATWTVNLPHSHMFSETFFWPCCMYWCIQEKGLSPCPSK